MSLLDVQDKFADLSASLKEAMDELKDWCKHCVDEEFDLAVADGMEKLIALREMRGRVDAEWKTVCELTDGMPPILFERTPVLKEPDVPKEPEKGEEEDDTPYRMPSAALVIVLLCVLRDAGGKMRTKDAVKAVYDIVEPFLTCEDMKHSTSRGEGYLNWRTALSSAVEASRIHGALLPYRNEWVWELSEEGSELVGNICLETVIDMMRRGDIKGVARLWSTTRRDAEKHKISLGEAYTYDLFR